MYLFAQSPNSSQDRSMAGYGPERFFYDKSSYTGVHKKGGPSTKDSATVELSQHLDRSPADARGVKLGVERTGSFRQNSAFSSGKWNSSPATQNFPGRSVEVETPERRLNRTSSGRKQNPASFSASGAEMLRTGSSSGRKPAAGAGYGPERFFYDKGSYTGVHKNGGPTTSDSGTVQLENLLDRSPADARGVKLDSIGRLSSAGREMLRSSSSSAGKWNSSFRSSTENFPGRSPLAGSDAKDSLRQSSSRRLDRSASGRQVYGPERFFYDKSSYTGAHKNGGPSTVDAHNVDLSQHLDRSPADVRGVKVSK